MTILDNNLHTKPRQTRGTELFRFRNYIALSVLSVGALAGLAFHFSSIGKAALQHHSKYAIDLNARDQAIILPNSKSPADMLLDYKEEVEFEKYNQ